MHILTIQTFGSMGPTRCTPLPWPIQDASEILPLRWPPGVAVLEWGSEAAVASFEAYKAAFRERPGFPAWSQAEWLERLTGDPDFLHGASLCALLDGEPAGFVVCSRGWIDQVGVVPAHRRLGLATALTAEASARLGGLGFDVVRLHVNANNAGALATWQRLGFRDCGGRGRFERVVPTGDADTR